MQVMWTLALQHHPTAGTHEATTHAGEITLLLRSRERDTYKLYGSFREETYGWAGKLFSLT